MASRFLHDPKYALAYGLLALLLLLAGGLLFREAGHLRERAEGTAAENQLLLSYQHAERNAARQDFLSSLFQKASASAYGELLEEAVNYCKERGLVFYAVNQNHPEDKSVEGPRKLMADMFIDDRNFGGLPDWGFIYNYCVIFTTTHEVKSQSF